MSWSIAPDDPRWPEGLLELDGRAPERLHGVGSLTCLAGLRPEQAVTIVGARRATAYGREMAHELGAQLAQAGLVIVSGMARGCDSAAHEGALEAGGRTIAVLAAGPHPAYPPEARPLHRRIARSGAVIGEHPPGTRPERWWFAARNRIMAALAGMTIVVEGRHKSGTRVTSVEALDLGREVGAVPGRVGSALSELPNDLLREGAAVIRGAQDVLDTMLGTGHVAARPVGPRLDAGLTAALRSIEGGAATCDAVALELGDPGRGVALAIARLELLGYVVADSMGRLARTALATSP